MTFEIGECLPYGFRMEMMLELGKTLDNRREQLIVQTLAVKAV
jgi:hypothetical protein